jgi:hypothetical protein
MGWSRVGVVGPVDLGVQRGPRLSGSIAAAVGQSAYPILHRTIPTVFAMATHWTLGCDANDPHRLADFWAHALGYVREPGYDDPDGASIIDTGGRAPAIGWLRVPEGKSAKTRLHIDNPRGG